MMDIDLEVSSFLEETRVAVLGTTNAAGVRIRNDFGSLHQTPIWFSWEDGEAYMFTSRRSVKWQNILTRPYASLCVDRRDPPYASVILSGDITEVDRPIYESVRSMAMRYYGEKKGQEFAEMYRDNPASTVCFKLTPNRVVRNL